MPTRAVQPSVGLSSHLTLRGPENSTQELSPNWTDDLPVCHLSGVGLSTNQLYREDGQRREEHEFEDRSFHFKVDENTQLYGIFDGHDGFRASDFATQRIPAELLLGQLNGKNGDAEVKRTLEQAFVAVENGFFQSIDDLLAEKANIQMEIPEGLSSYQTYQQFPEVIDKLQSLNAEIAGGTTAVVALVHNQKLYIANVGDSRALLCKADASGSLVVEQLTVDHDIYNEDERLRLVNLNLDVDKLLSGNKIGNQDNTRCIGNYSVKGGYKDFDLLSSARGEPVTADPNIVGGLPIADNFRFLLLMSDGLYRAVEAATGTTQANRDIALMVAEQFSVNSTLMGVAQGAVDRVVRLHHDAYVSDPRRYQKRDDITLLVRKFSQPLGGVGGGTPSPSQTLSLPPFSAATAALLAAGTITAGVSTYVSSTNASSVASSSTAGFTATTTTDTVNSFQAGRRTSRLVIGEDGFIEPYVDFSEFYVALEAARQAHVQANLG